MTYSIIARDAETGQMGVAVQSHLMGVGRYVPWGLAGVGVVATQAAVEPRYGPDGLAFMAQGRSARDALNSCLAADPNNAARQVAMLDHHGSAAARTGSACIKFAADESVPGASAQANMVASTDIPRAMLAGYHAGQGPLSGRLLDALAAGEQAGGDLRGRQSAAILVVAGERHDNAEAGAGVLIDLRVEDHVEPIAELRRLVELHDAFVPVWAAMRGPAIRGPVAADDETLAAALSAFMSAQPVYGDGNLEPTFWRSVALARAGRTDEAQVLLDQISAHHAGWRQLFTHLDEAGWLAGGNNIK